MGMIQEFRDFAMKGNVVDMAVGIIIGGAFGKIVSSMVNDIIMPVVGAFSGGGSLGAQFVWLGQADKPASLELARESGEAFVAWGPFVQTTLDFLIIALSIFVAIKVMNAARARFERQQEEEEAPAEPSDEVKILTEIRDALAKNA